MQSVVVIIQRTCVSVCLWRKYAPLFDFDDEMKSQCLPCWDIFELDYSVIVVIFEIVSNQFFLNCNKTRTI